MLHSSLNQQSKRLSESQRKQGPLSEACAKELDRDAASFQDRCPRLNPTKLEPLLPAIVMAPCLSPRHDNLACRRRQSKASRWGSLLKRGRKKNKRDRFISSSRGFVINFLRNQQKAPKKGAF